MTEIQLPTQTAASYPPSVSGTTTSGPTTILGDFCDLLGDDDAYPQFPADLKALPRWVVWRYESRDGNATKILFDPRAKCRADSTDPSTWGSFAEAIEARKAFAGVGCVIADPYCAIDLDKCRDAQTGITEPWAERIIRELDSYTELSPSGRGFHIWVKARKPAGTICRKGRIECYDQARYFTVTGQHILNTPQTIEERDLASFLERLKAGRLEPSSTGTIEASSSESAPATSQSEIDFRVCVDFARKFGNDPERIEAEFNKTQHAQREKWTSRPEYRQQTIQKAIESAGILSAVEGDELPVEKIPSYPNEVLTGDLIGDLTLALTEGTPIPPQFVRENIKVVIGAVIDGIAGYPGHEDIHTRQYNINVSLHPRSGKGESWKRVAGFNTGILWNLLDEHQVKIVPSGLGSGEVLIKKLGRFEKEGFQRVILRYDELGELLAKSNILGSSLESKLLSFYETRSGAADSLAHGEMEVQDVGVSLSGDFVEQDFTNAFSGRGSAGRGFLPRCVLNYAGAASFSGDWKHTDCAKTIRVCTDIEDCVDVMKQTAEREGGRWIPKEDDAARTLRLEFFEWIKTQDPRLTPELMSHLKRDLIQRALFSESFNITTAKVERSIAWCKHQLALREALWPQDGGDNVEQMTHRILKALDCRTLSVTRLMDYCHTKRLGSGGPEAFNRALRSLLATQQIRQVGKNRKNQAVYTLA